MASYLLELFYIFNCLSSCVCLCTTSSLYPFLKSSNKTTLSETLGKRNFFFHNYIPLSLLITLSLISQISSACIFETASIHTYIHTYTHTFIWLQFLKQWKVRKVIHDLLESYQIISNNIIRESYLSHKFDENRILTFLLHKITEIRKKRNIANNNVDPNNKF